MSSNIKYVEDFHAANLNDLAEQLKDIHKKWVNTPSLGDNPWKSFPEVEIETGYNLQGHDQYKVTVSWWV